MSGVLDGLKALGAARLAAMGGVAAAVFGLLVVLVLHGGAARMGLLYADLDLREAAQMADTPEHQHIPHQVGAGGSEILVPTDRIDLPHREPFARDEQAPQASMLLTLAGSMRPDHEEVQAILNLVAAAVPGLRPENITLADSRGNLLARAGQGGGPHAVSIIALASGKGGVGMIRRRRTLLPTRHPVTRAAALA